MRGGAVILPFAPPVPAPRLRPSRYQQAVMDAVADATDNILVQACAGSGKTSTLRMATSVIPNNQRVQAVCFAKVNAEDFRAALPPHVAVGTAHSVGLAICRANVPGVTVELDKGKRIIREYAKQHKLESKRFRGDFQALSKWHGDVQRLITMALATMTDIESIDSLEFLADYFDIDYPAEFFCDVTEIMRRMRDDRMHICYDDMIDHPLEHNYAFPECDFVLGDEQQDFNLQQIEFLRRLVGSGRFLGVGDRFQAIYAWRGAAADAMDRISEAFGCVELPLSVCYRCDQNIVREAQKVVGVRNIQWHDGAEEGLVIEQEPFDLGNALDTLDSGDMVVCRTNKPLVEPAFSLIRRGVKAVIRGRDIGVGLNSIITAQAKRKNTLSLKDLLRNIDSWAQRRIERLAAHNATSAAQNVEDQVATIIAVAERESTIEGLQARIKTLFSDATEGVVFSSIHRAKGLEADCVMFLAPEQLPHPMARTPEAREQERNLDYVARTRARHCLVYQPLKEKETKGRVASGADAND